MDHSSDSLSSQPTFHPRDFEALERMVPAQGFESALAWMEQQFRQRRLYPQLFEVLKMQCRFRLGLPLINVSSMEQLPDTLQRQLEDGLLAACREVGLLLWEQGQLSQGWMYLQAVGNRPEIAEALQRFPIDEENVDSLIEIAISQGAAPQLGYRLLLEKYGTCNAITTFDMQAARFDETTQREMASTLLHHLYDELKRNILYRLQQAAEQLPGPETPKIPSPELTIAQILQNCPQASAGNGHHIDATHLASVVRIARLVRDRQDLQLAYELTTYGMELHSDFQYPGQPPFEDTYLDHEKFYQVQLGIHVEEGLQHFRDKCDAVSTERFGAIAYESLADLLIRVGRRAEAIRLLTGHVWGKLAPTGLLGNVFLIPQTPEERAQLREYFRSQQDLLSFGMSLFEG